MIPLSIEMDMLRQSLHGHASGTIDDYINGNLLLYFFKNPAVLHKEIYRHPIIQILLLHLV